MMHDKTLLSLSISSSEDLDNYFDEKFGQPGMSYFLEECGMVYNKLITKHQVLKEWELKLLNKEKDLLNMTKNLDIIVQCGIKSNEENKTNEAVNSNLALNKKNKSLNKNYERALKSLEVLKSQKNSLEEKLKLLQSNEITLKKEIKKLKSRNYATIPVNKLKLDFATQTEGIIAVQPNYTKSNGETNVDTFLSLMPVMRNIWTILYHNSLNTMLSINKSENTHTLIDDLCLLIIPVFVDQMRTSLSKINNHNISSSMTFKRSEILFYHLELLYWSFVYLDIKRIPIRKTLNSTLARCGEELIVYYRKLSDISTDKNIIPNIVEKQILVLLVALRTVNHANDLSLIFNFIFDLIKRNNNVLSLLLSKLFFVPLLCRWSSAFNSHGTISSKIIQLVYLSLDTFAEVSINTGSKLLCTTGINQLITLALQMPISIADSNSYTNYHLLVFLLDLLYSSDSSDKERVVEIIDRIISVKPLRRLLKDLGLIGIINCIISKSGDCFQSQTSNQCLGRLKTIISKLNMDSAGTI